MEYINDSNEQDSNSESDIQQDETPISTTQTDDNRRNKITAIFENMLCSKLIISKESNMLILKPHLIYEILHHLRQANASNIKFETVEKLNWMINRIHTNAFILTNESKLKNRHNSYIHFINELIDLLLENNRESVFSDNLLQFIEKVIINSGLKIEYIKHVLQRIGELFINYDANKFAILLKLLNVYIN
jgi:hypothetical protein